MSERVRARDLCLEEDSYDLAEAEKSLDPGGQKFFSAVCSQQPTDPERMLSGGIARAAVKV